MANKRPTNQPISYSQTQAIKRNRSIIKSRRADLATITM